MIFYPLSTLMMADIKDPIWFEFANEIFYQSQISNIKVAGVSTKEYPTAAVRPFNSRLDKSCLIDCGYGKMP